ncbi:hypothetical protein [uncultured Tessaracoccus sp.]|uniref:hypothetical protein n=1 Tax=uncultured Tessaracoccus sp. TaxID=905023 RepID=UPI00260A70F9|nr:hypothetical protein [uncultured Tessaracoccus sp.]
MAQRHLTGSGSRVKFAPSSLRRMAADHVERCTTASSAAAQALGGATSFPLPPMASELQSSIESLLSELISTTKLLDEMTESFRQRAEATATEYETVESRHAGLINTTLGAL